MAKTVQVTIPATITTSIKVLGDKNINLEDKSADWFAWAIANGVRQSVGDADAGKAGTAEGEKAIADKFDRIAVKGEVPAGGGFSRLSDEDYALKETLKSKGHKFEKGQSVAAALTAYTKAIAESQEKEYTEDMDLKVEAALSKTAVYRTALEARKAKSTKDDEEISL